VDAGTKSEFTLEIWEFSRILWLSMELNSKGLTFKFFTAARLELKENRRFLDKPLISLRQKS